MRHGSNIDPPNRFETVRQERDFEQLAPDDDFVEQVDQRSIEILQDESKSIVSENSSPDLPFRYSLNPYRGCIHGCSYCYARPTHEYLGFNAGLDFETRIVVKKNAPELFRKFLSRKNWQPEPITFSGVTDCYQPIEREFRLTRGCLEVALDCRQPIGIVTKNALVTRDLDLLSELAKLNLVHIYISITTLDAQLARDMEPRTSTPAARLRAIKRLTENEIPTGLMIAPVIPGLNDAEIPSILEAANQSGATVANYILLRLPLTVEPVFREWLGRTQKIKSEKILGLVCQTREGKMSSSTFGERMVGKGPIAEQIRSLFHVCRNRLEMNKSLPRQSVDQFVSPGDNRQKRLF